MLDRNPDEITRCPKCDGLVVKRVFIEAAMEFNIDPDTGKEKLIEGSRVELGRTDEKIYCSSSIEDELGCGWDSWDEEESIADGERKYTSL